MLVVAVFRALIYKSLRYFFQLQSWLNKEFYVDIKVEELILRLVLWEDVLPTISLSGLRLRRRGAVGLGREVQAVFFLSIRSLFSRVSSFVLHYGRGDPMDFKLARKVLDAQCSLL